MEQIQTYVSRAVREYNGRPDDLLECDLCNQQSPVRLLVVIRRTPDGEPQALACASCLCINELRDATIQAEHDGQWMFRCDRCGRRNRALDAVQGFKLCAECKGDR